MLFEIAQFLFIGLIAVPFLYMIVDVTLDVLQRGYGFYRRQVRPVRIRPAEKPRRR